MISAFPGVSPDFLAAYTAVKDGAQIGDLFLHF